MQRLIGDNLLLVDGEEVSPSYKVKDGQLIEAQLPDEGVSQEEIPVPVIFEDEFLLVVDKPAGLVVHPAAGHERGTLVNALIAHCGESLSGIGGVRRPGIVHRLDKDTSGLLVVAKDDAVHRALKVALAARRIRREYLALVEGRPPARSGTIEAPVGRDRRRRIVMSLDTDAPKAAVTHFEIERALPHATLLRVRLQTGRTHQIRVHLQAIGHPVCGDPDYGHKGLYGLRRQFLHAARLALAHPMTGAGLDIASPLPPDLRDALQAARGA